MATAKKTAAKSTKSAKPTAKKVVKKVAAKAVKIVKVVKKQPATKVKVATKAAKPKAKVANSKPKPAAKNAVAKKKPAQKLAQKVVKKPVKKMTKPVPKPTAKKANIAAKPTPKVTKVTKKAAKTPAQPINPIKTSKALPNVTSKSNAKLATTSAPVIETKVEVKLVKLTKAEKLSKATKAVVAATTPLVKGAKGAIAATTSAPPPTGGKANTKPSLIAATPPPPMVVVHAPVRALPKSMTVKAAVSNVLPFNPNTKRVDGMISEAEILKQTKDQYMSKAQLAFFKHRLVALATQLRENAGQTTEHLRELAIVPDPADRATLEEEHALELRARDRERKLLKKVEAAILRVDEGSYGYCDETGDPIGIPRLLARPTATLTIEAQERRELKQRMFGE